MRTGEQKNKICRRVNRCTVSAVEKTGEHEKRKIEEQENSICRRENMICSREKRITIDLQWEEQEQGLK